MKVEKHPYHETGLNPEILDLTEDLLEKIANGNGSPIEKVREWLELGLPVHTNFSYFVKAEDRGDQ